jgi:hypothetical protein
MRIRYVVTMLLLLAAGAVAWAADQTPIAPDPFKALLAAAQSPPTGVIRDVPYPSEPAVSLLSAWMMTGDEAYLKAAQRQLDVSHGCVDREGLYIATVAGQGDSITRDTTARHLISYYVFYRATGDRHLLIHADRCLDAMMEHLQRVPVEYKGRQYTVFAPVYEARKPYKPMPGAWIDAADDAALGLAFTVLCNDEHSKWYHKPAARDIALAEIEASAALQDMQTGAIAVGSSREWRDKPDTARGSFTLLAWQWANSIWADPLMAVHIRRACDWLDPYFDAGAQAPLWYPERSTGRMTATSAWQVFAAFAANGRDLRRLNNLCASDLAAVTSDTPLSGLAGQAYLHAMDAPLETVKAAGLSAKWWPAPIVPGQASLSPKW